MGDEGVAAMAELLAVNWTLTRLTLKGVNATEKSGNVLARGLIRLQLMAILLLLLLPSPPSIVSDLVSDIYIYIYINFVLLL